MLKRFSLAAFAALSLLCAAEAPAYAGAEGAKHFLQDIGNKAVAIAARKQPFAARQAELEKLFTKSVDVPWVARFVLGKYWREATPAQQKAYLERYQGFLVKHYTSKFADYAGETFTITNVKEDGDNEYTLTMDIARPHAEDIVVDYRLREAGGSYKIFDIIVEGVSLITTHRSDFSAYVSQQGLDALIAELDRKTAALVAQQGKSQGDKPPSL